MEAQSCVVSAVVAVILLTIIFQTQILKWITSLRIYKRLFALLYYHWQKYPNPSQKIREKLLAQVIEKLTEIGGDVVEVGIGSGRNLEYMRLPRGSSLIAVDYNPNMEGFLRESIKKFPNNNIDLKKFIVEDAANMKSIEDNSVSLVLATQLHCSLDEESIRKAMAEIKRVLKKGGYYFFLEHVLDEPGTLRRLIQRFAYSVLILLPILGGGCRSDRETWKYLYQTGFREISFQRCKEDFFFFWSAPLLSILRYMSRSKIVGFAIK